MMVKVIRPDAGVNDSWWSYWFPLVKWLFSSPFVLWACGWSYLLLTLFYPMIDVIGLRRWVVPLVVIGTNAIVACCCHFYRNKKSLRV